MAEIVTLVVDKLIQLIAQEANLLKGVHGEVQSIKDELESIASFLVEADAREARGDSNDLIRTWVKQVRDLAYRIEDAIDMYKHHVARRRHQQGVSSFLHKTGRSIKKLSGRHEIASEIEEIKKDVVEIKSRADRYGLILSTHQGMVVRQRVTNSLPITSLFIAEAEIVGMEGPRDVLTNWLQKDGQGERLVISVVGMGGLGKTTLARKVYDSEVDQFDCHAWVTVSQTFSLEEMLKSIIGQFRPAHKECVADKIDQLIMELRDYLGQKRYVVVFDDVWSRELCQNMIHALPTNNKCSRIIFTTRSEDVAPSDAQSCLHRVYKLSLLPFDKSFELFCKKVFQSCNGGMCPPELVGLSTNIVNKCDGLPLAIVAVGGVLSCKEKNVSEWMKFLNSLRSKLESDEQMTRVNKILSLSYHDLSVGLKSCLLYLGIYPEDHSIRCSRLIRQWIAEGFVKAKNNEVLEDVAEECLSELIRRSLVQVSEVDWCGKIRECRVHDLMREVILLKSKDMRFCGIFGENVDGKARRLSMVKYDLNTVGSYNSANVSLIRSLFAFGWMRFPQDFMRALFGHLKLLKMLDLEGTGVESLPESVGDLFHLSYLSVRKTSVSFLPKSIGKLAQLETLDIKDSEIRELPVEIKRLQKLRHLLGYSFNEESENFDLAYYQGVRIQEGLGCPETLQKLVYVEANNGTIVKELINFSKLRKLGVTKVRSEDVIQLCRAIENMRELRTLEIILLDEQQVLDLESIHSPPPLLQRLWLKGPMHKVPSWIIRLQNVVKLIFCFCGIKTNMLPACQDLPNLLDLTISYDAYEGDQLHFKKGGFQKLKSLNLTRLSALKNLIIEEGALPCLEELQIGAVETQMMEVPSNIQRLTNLKRIKLFDFPDKLCMMMVPDGPSYYIIQHIPDVELCFSNDVLQHESFSLARYQQTHGPHKGDRLF